MLRHQPAADPHAMRDEEHGRDDLPLSHAAKPGSSTLSAAFALAKTIDGAGCFAMPWAVHTAGLIGFTAALLVCAGVGALTMEALMEAKRYACANDYAETARWLLGPRAAACVT